MDNNKKTVLLKLANYLSFGVDRVESEVGLAIENPKEYFVKFSDRLGERGINKIEKTLPWIALVDALIEDNFAWEIDWKEDMEDICEAIEKLLTRKSWIEVSWLSEDRDHLEELETEDILVNISKDLNKNYLVLAFMDIDSDSYVLIVALQDDFRTLQDLAEEAGYNISTFI